MKKRILLISLFIIMFMICIPNIAFAAWSDKKFNEEASDELGDKQAWIQWVDPNKNLKMIDENKGFKTGRESEKNKLNIKKEDNVVKGDKLVFRIYFEASGMDVPEAVKWTKMTKIDYRKNDKDKYAKVGGTGEKGKDKNINTVHFEYIIKEVNDEDDGWWFNHESIQHGYSIQFKQSGEYKCYFRIGDGEEGERLWYMIQVYVNKDEKEKFADELLTAYQGNVPSTSDGAKEIIKFIISDVYYNSGTKVNTGIELDKLKAWKVVIEEFNDRNSPAMNYKDQALKNLQATIYEKEGTISAEEADKIRESARKSIESILYIATSAVDPGQDRTSNTFYDVLGNVEDYIPGADLSNDAEAEEMISVVLTIITNVGMVLSVLVPAILGVKYMLGSTEEKAQYKEALLPYFIGSVLLFGICSVVKILQEVGVFINS